jgi:hypothetical protein
MTEAKETAAEVWARTVTKPISREDVRGEDPKAETQPERAPDRALVAPELAKFVQAKKGKKLDPIEARLASIESALRPEPEPERISEQEQLLRELRSVKEREEQRLAELEQQSYEQQLATYTKAIEEQLTAQKDKFPGLIKAKLTGNVVTKLLEELERGTATSEEEIASKAESELKAFYLNLKSVYEPEPEAKPQPSSEDIKPKPKTLTSSLVSGEEQLESEDLYTKYGKDGARLLWEKMNR